MFAVGPQSYQPGHHTLQSSCLCLTVAVCQGNTLYVGGHKSTPLLLVRSSGTSGSAPDLTSEMRAGGGSSPVTEVWTNPAHEEDGSGSGGLVTRSMTPSRSSGSITPNHRRPHRLPDNINRELERKIGNGPGVKGSKNSKSSESDGSPDEGFNLNNRKKPGTLNDNFTRQR